MFAGFCFGPSTEEMSQINPLIDVCFAHPTVEMIRESLQSVDGVWENELTML